MRVVSKQWENSLAWSVVSKKWGKSTAWSVCFFRSGRWVPWPPDSPPHWRPLLRSVHMLLSSFLNKKDRQKLYNIKMFSNLLLAFVYHETICGFKKKISPPVANRSSTITTDCPGLNDSFWTSNTSYRKEKEHNK